MEDDDDYDIPSANPAIRQDYEAALGRLILAHNEVDFRLTALLSLAASSLDHGGGLDSLTKGDFSRRLDHLNLVQRAAPQLNLNAINVDQLRSLNAVKNAVAHGHFDQNPFDGSFEILSQRAKSRAREAREAYPTTRLLTTAETLEGFASHMQAIAAFYAFDRDDSNA